MPLTVSYWQHISPFATFSSFSKVVSSISTLTASVLSCTGCTIWQSPRWYRRSITPVPGIHLPLHLCRQVHSLAWSYTYGWCHRRLLCTCSVPLTITSDQGSQFESDLWRELMHLLGTTRHRTTAYHPQASGLVERFHRSFKDGLGARLAGANWVSDLPIVLLGIRTSLKEDLSCTAAEMVYGSTLRLPGDFFSAPTPMDPSSFVSKLRHTMQSQQFIPTGSQSLMCPGISIRHPMFMFVGMATDALWLVATLVHSRSSAGQISTLPWWLMDSQRKSL